MQGSFYAESDRAFACFTGCVLCLRCVSASCSVAWVKSQSRMASTSNQETFRAEGLSGRVVYDVLRQVRGVGRGWGG